MFLKEESLPEQAVQQTVTSFGKPNVTNVALILAVLKVVECYGDDLSIIFRIG